MQTETPEHGVDMANEPPGRLCQHPQFGPVQHSYFYGPQEPMCCGKRQNRGVFPSLSFILDPYVW